MAFYSELVFASQGYGRRFLGLRKPRFEVGLHKDELRLDRKAGGIIGAMLSAGLRASEVIDLNVNDVSISPRSGQCVCRHGKGNKEGTIPLSIELRRLLVEYIESRPPSNSGAVFIGERGAFTCYGLRAICQKYAALTGTKFTAHALRHTFVHRCLRQTNNDLVGLAQILWHESLNTTSLYARRNNAELQASIEGLRYE